MTPGRRSRSGCGTITTRPTPSWQFSGARSTSTPWTRGLRRRSSSCRSGSASACRRTRGSDQIRVIAPSGLISVIWQEIEGSFAVGGAGVGVEANGVEAGMAEHVGDGDQVGAAADEGGGEGAAADVGGDVLFVEVGVGGDGRMMSLAPRTDSRCPQRFSSSAGLLTGADWS